MNAQLSPNIAITVLNWNDADETLACLHAYSSLSIRTARYGGNISYGQNGV